VLVDGIIIVVVVASLLGALLLRRRSHDDVHSVEGYHRQIHTLEVISEHPAGSEAPSDAAEPPKHAFPESAVRLTDSTTVRIIAAPPEAVPPPTVPPAVPPPEEEAAVALSFDDAPPTPPGHRPAWMQDRAIGTMNRRPRQLAAPALAVAAVTALVVVLLVLGSHKSTPGHHRVATPTGITTTSRPTTTSTTTPPLPNVSAPHATSAADATYEVGSNSYTLTVSATSSECWIDVTGATGAGIFSGILDPGQHQTIPATGLVSVEIGAPSSFAANVNGTAVALPAGYQTPLTLHFTPPASAAA
jgi:hypothetical protein